MIQQGLHTCLKESPPCARPTTPRLTQRSTPSCLTTLVQVTVLPCVMYKPVAVRTVHARPLLGAGTSEMHACLHT